MESQPQNPEFRNNPENFHPCTTLLVTLIMEICSIPVVSKHIQSVYNTVDPDQIASESEAI